MGLFDNTVTVSVGDLAEAYNTIKDLKERLQETIDRDYDTQYELARTKDSLRYAKDDLQRAGSRNDFLETQIRQLQSDLRLARLQSGNNELFLNDFGINKINIIKVVREITGYGLKEVKDLVESAPCTIVGGMSPEVAEMFASRINQEGGNACVKDSATASDELVNTPKDA